MVTLLKKAIFAGVGMTQRACEIVDDFSKRGETHQSEIAQRIKALMEQGEQVETEVKQKIQDLAKRISCRIPSKADMERFEKELAELTEQVQTLKSSIKGSV